MADLNQIYAVTFQEASGYKPEVYSNLIRFIAVALVLIAVGFAVNHFLGEEAKLSEGFISKLGIRTCLVFLSLTVFLLCLTV